MQSIGNCVTGLEKLLKDNTECLFFGITEHWKSEDQLHQIGIENFQLASFFCRDEGQHGGSAIYVKNNLNFSVLKKINSLAIKGEFECAAVQCFVNKIKTNVVSIYRPPSGNKDIFFNQMEKMLSKINTDTVVFIVGDFNLEMLVDNPNKNRLFSLMSFYNIVGTVFQNTRITLNCGSCLDNIFTNLDEYKTDILEYHLSDHTAQRLCFDIINKTDKQFTYKRFFTENNKNEFLTLLESQDWENVRVIENNNVNLQWNSFINTYKHIFNQCFPIVMSYKNKKVKTPSNEQINECKRKLDILLVLSKHSSHYKIIYNDTRKEYNRLLKSEKIYTYEKRVQKSDNKMKCMWNICKELSGKVQSAQCHHGNDNAQVLSDNFNDHLLSIVPKLLKEQINVPFNCSISDNSQSMYISKVTKNELLDICCKLKNKYSSGEDEIPTSIVKLSMIKILDVLKYILDNSLKFGIFPDQLKVANIIPLYKNKGDSESLDNYRPISLLPSFSKVFEMAMCSRLVGFINKCELFSSRQHGYLKGRSTTTAIFQFTTAILQHLENKNIALGLFLDLSKAYDCVNHDFLIYKMEKYGIRGNALAWIKSYLSDRPQRVVINDKKSNIRINKIGIAQGSILGPILFVIYLNDLCRIEDNFLITNFADDTNLLVPGLDIQSVTLNSHDALEKTSRWFMENKLMINKNKTNLILFKTKNKNLNEPELLTLANSNHKLEKSTKFLGLIIDEFLSWHQHVDNLCLKLGKIGYGISVVTQYVNTNVSRILYFANFESLLRYGIIFWGGSSDIQRVFVVQKRVLRRIKKLGFMCTCRGSFRELKIMTVYALYIFECIMFVFKNRDHFGDTGVHSYNTRSNNVLYPQHRLTLTEKSPYYMCVKLFNKLPLHMKNITSLKALKRILKQVLIETEPYSVNDFLESSL